MKHAEAERIASALVLAILIHLVIAIILAFTVPWESDSEEEFREPIRVVLNEPVVEQPPEPVEPEAEEPLPPEDSEPEPTPEPTPEIATAPEPESPAPEQPRATPQAEQPRAESWEIPREEEPSQPAPPAPEPRLREELTQSFPTGPDAQFREQQREQMEREFAALEEELSQIEQLQEELIAARSESAAPDPEPSAAIETLQRRLDQALSDLNRPGQEDGVVRVGPEGEPAGPQSGAVDGPQTSGGRGLVAGDARPSFSSVQWRDGLPGEVVVTVRFWVNPQGEVVDREFVPADLSLLARSGLREAINRTINGWRFERAPSAGAREPGRVVYVIER